MTQIPELTEPQWQVHCYREAADWRRDLCEGPTPNKLVSRQFSTGVVLEPNSLHAKFLQSNSRYIFYGSTFVYHRFRTVNVDPGRSYLLFCTPLDRIEISCSRSAPNRTALVRIITVDDDQAQSRFVLPLRNHKEITLVLQNGTSTRFIRFPQNYIVRLEDFDQQYNNIKLARKEYVRCSLTDHEAGQFFAKLPTESHAYIRIISSVQQTFRPPWVWTEEHVNLWLREQMGVKEGEPSTSLFKGDDEHMDEYEGEFMNIAQPPPRRKTAVAARQIQPPTSSQAQQLADEWRWEQYENFVKRTLQNMERME